MTGKKKKTPPPPSPGNNLPYTDEESILPIYMDTVDPEAIAVKPQPTPPR